MLEVDPLATFMGTAIGALTGEALILASERFGFADRKATALMFRAVRGVAFGALITFALFVMTYSPWVIFVVLALVGMGVFVWYQWFQMFNSPNGERYQKQAAQGPFAPAVDDDVKSRG